MRVDEQGAAQELHISVNENLKALHVDQQQLQQTAQQLLCSKSSFECFGRSQAAWQLAKQQSNTLHTARVLKQDAATLQQVRHANTVRLQYDQTAADKVLQCMRLEHNVRQLDSLIGRRPYNRLHPRYTLE